MLMCSVICPRACTWLLESRHHICTEQNQANLFFQAPSRLKSWGANELIGQQSQPGEAASSVQGLQGSLRGGARAGTAELLTSVDSGELAVRHPATMK